jgi:hypothetical protein
VAYALKIGAGSHTRVDRDQLQFGRQRVNFGGPNEPDMPNALQPLYANLGHLFYSIAASDRNVAPAEVTKLKALIRTQWMPLENSRDEFGTDAAHYIDIAFDHAHDHGMSADDAFARFESHFRADPALYDVGLRRMVRESAGAIASSFAGRNKSEVRQLVTLELLFREHPVA